MKFFKHLDNNSIWPPNFFYVCQLSPLVLGNGTLFEQTWIPFTHRCFVHSLVEIGPVVLEMKFKMWKVYRQTDWWSEKLTWAFSKTSRIISIFPTYISSAIEHDYNDNLLIKGDALNRPCKFLFHVHILTNKNISLIEKHINWYFEILCTLN